MQRLSRSIYRLVPASVALASVAVVLSACSGDDITRNMGLQREAPDEFQVTTRAPLSMPPDFQIRPPRPGAPRPQEQSTSTAAEATLVPQAALAQSAAGTTIGQQALVDSAGPAAPADIRNKVEAEASLDRPSQTLTDKLMFWKSPPPPGIVVDPAKEAQRIRQNAALGQSMEQGDTPIIQRSQQSKSFFGSLF